MSHLRGKIFTRVQRVCGLILYDVRIAVHALFMRRPHRALA